MRKKAITTALIFALVLSCTACGGKKTDDTQQGTLSEVTQTPTEAPEDAYVPPKPNEEKTETSEDITPTEAPTTEEAYFDDNNIYEVSGKGTYFFSIPYCRLVEGESYITEDGTCVQNYIAFNDTFDNVTLEARANTTLEKEVNDVKAMIQSEGFKQVADGEEVGTYCKFKHFSFYTGDGAVDDDPNSSFESPDMFHIFVGERTDGKIGIITGQFLVKEEWQYMFDTIQENYIIEVDANGNEITEAPTEETSTETEQPSEGDTETQTESSTEAGSTEE